MIIIVSAIAAITAPNHPSRESDVIIMPAIKTPQNIESKDGKNFSPIMKARIDPVHAPVNGNGIPTKSASPSHSYLCILFSCFLVRINIQFINLFPGFTRLKNLASESKKRSKTGTGNILPMMEIHKALYQGMANVYIPTGMAARSSVIGKMEISNTINSGNSCRLSNHSSVFIKNWI